MRGLSKAATLVAEFLGTAALILIVLAVTKSGVGFSVFVAASTGAVLAGLLYVAGRYSLGHYNPAATVALWSIRRIKTPEAIAYLAVQGLGAVAAWKLFEYITGQQLQNLPSTGFDLRSFVAQMAGGFIFMLAVAAVLYRKASNAEWAITAGVALFAGMLIASIGSNGLINPAEALGVGVRNWNWSAFIAPVVGGIIGANVYMWLFAPAVPRGAAAAVVSTTDTVRVSEKATVSHSSSRRGNRRKK